MTAETAQDTEAEQPQDWFFTFGGQIPALRYHYVRLHGTWEQARARMDALYSFRWMSQYPSAEDAEVEKYGLTELVLPSHLLEQTR